MSSKFLTIFLVLVIAAFCLAQQETAKLRSVWDGVYTDEQAKRGEPLYQQRCASCHGDKLTGGESAPPLTGGQFLSNWNGLTLDILFERIRTSMPSDNPAKVTRPAKADILAYILSMNSIPSGKTELPFKAETMKDVLIQTTKPKASESKTGAR